MAANITGISPAKGSAFGGQEITITGTGFGASGSVTIEGRTATPVSWSATSAVVKTPAREDGEGIIFGGGSVAVVLTAEDLSTVSTAYEYASTRIERALMSMASRVGSCTVQEGYNFTISPAQVRTMREDSSVDTAAGWPQVLIFADPIETLTDEPFDHVKDTVNVVVQAVRPCDNPQTWQIEAFAMLSDIRRAIMNDRSNGGTCNTTTVLSAETGRSSDNAAGALSGATVLFQIEVPSIINDMTTNTVYDSNLP